MFRRVLEQDLLIINVDIFCLVIFERNRTLFLTVNYHLRFTFWVSITRPKISFITNDISTNKSNPFPIHFTHPRWQNMCKKRKRDMKTWPHAKKSFALVMVCFKRQETTTVLFSYGVTFLLFLLKWQFVLYESFFGCLLMEPTHSALSHWISKKYRFVNTKTYQPKWKMTEENYFILWTF